MTVKLTRRKRFFNWITDIKATDLAIVLLTAGLVLVGILQWSVIRNEFEAAERPYIGISSFEPRYTTEGQPGITNDPTPTSNHMNYEITVKNFGTIPGSNVVAIQELYVNNVLHPSAQSSVINHMTVWPQQQLWMYGNINSTDYKEMMNGTKDIHVDVTLSYVGPAKSYSICEREVFFPPMRQFADAGPCPK